MWSIEFRKNYRPTVFAFIMPVLEVCGVWFFHSYSACVRKFDSCSG